MTKSDNGAAQPPVIQNLAGLSQLSADGQSYEIRVHCIQQMGNGEGIVLGELVFRTFRGGMGCMQHLVNEGSKAAHSLFVQATSGLVLPAK